MTPCCFDKLYIETRRHAFLINPHSCVPSSVRDGFRFSWLSYRDFALDTIGDVSYYSFIPQTNDTDSKAKDEAITYAVSNMYIRVIQNFLRVYSTKRKK